nr:dirigent protein 3 [Phryma leptostachya subsp. asiatica]
MANTLSILILFSMMITMLSSANSRHMISSAQDEWFKNLNLAEEEKFTKLHFYIHDFVSGDNQSVYNVAESSITSDSVSNFGRVQVVDHLITVGPEVDSEKVGRVQGIHVMADLHEAALGVNWNFVFNDGSTITVVGRLVGFAKEGELSIVGGTGEYLMSRGIAFKKTLVMDPDTLNSIMEYTMYVYSSNPTGLFGV